MTYCCYAEFVLLYASEAERNRAQLNVDRFQQIYRKYTSGDTVKDSCKALWSIDWIANANKEPLDFGYKKYRKLV